MFILNFENLYYISVYGYFRKQNFEEKKIIGRYKYYSILVQCMVILF